MVLRILTALVLIPIVVALVWWGPPALLAALAGIVAILALVEFFETRKSRRTSRISKMDHRLRRRPVLRAIFAGLCRNPRDR